MYRVIFWCILPSPKWWGTVDVDQKVGRKGTPSHFLPLYSLPKWNLNFGLSWILPFKKQLLKSHTWITFRSLARLYPLPSNCPAHHREAFFGDRRHSSQGRPSLETWPPFPSLLTQEASHFLLSLNRKILGLISWHPFFSLSKYTYFSLDGFMVWFRAAAT